MWGYWALTVGGTKSHGIACQPIINHRLVRRRGERKLHEPIRAIATTTNKQQTTCNFRKKLSGGFFFCKNGDGPFPPTGLTIMWNILMCSCPEPCSIWSRLLLSRTLFPPPARQTSALLLLMPLTGGYLLPYMFSLQLYHGSRSLAAKHLAATAASSDGHLFEESVVSSLHYIFRLFKILPERTLSFGCPLVQSVI